MEEARQLKAARDKILAAGRRRGTKRRHVVVSFTLDELAEAVGVSKRTLQWWRRAGRVDLSDRAAVVELLRSAPKVAKCPRCGKREAHGFTSEGRTGKDGLRCVPR